jgi:hypothetical protein
LGPSFSRDPERRFLEASESHAQLWLRSCVAPCLPLPSLLPHYDSWPPPATDVGLIRLTRGTAPPTGRLSPPALFDAFSDSVRRLSSDSLDVRMTFPGQKMILGYGPTSRSSGPTESGPGSPPPGKPAGRTIAPRPSVPSDGLHATVSSPPSVPRLAHKPSVHMLYAPSESAQVSSPRWRTGPQLPRMTRWSDRPPGPIYREYPKPL